MKYSEKLKDPRWQKKRLEIMGRDKWECKSCFNTSRTLAVHHLRYNYNKDPWDYDDCDLITLCEKCHKREHEERCCYEKELIKALKDNNLLCFDIQDLANGFNKIKLNKELFFLIHVIHLFLSNAAIQSTVYKTIKEHFSEVNNGKTKVC